MKRTSADVQVLTNIFKLHRTMQLNEKERLISEIDFIL